LRAARPNCYCHSCLAQALGGVAAPKAALDFGWALLYFVDSLSQLDLPSGLARHVADHLAKAIIYDQFAPGEKLKEEDLARRLKVSRSPIREAFRILEKEGLLVFIPRRGVRVASLSATGVQEVYECRAVLEGLAASLACERMTTEALSRLRRIYASMERAARKPDVKLYFERVLAFLSEIRTLAGNATLTALLSGLDRRTLRYRYVVYAMIPGMIDVSLRTNAEILRAFEGGDAGGVRQLTEHLIREAGEGIRKHLPTDREPEA
jgi:DNA-binding GntR family transcriptional regulator